MELRRRQLDEDEKYSAGGHLMGMGNKFKGMHRSIVGLKGSMAGGI